MSVVVAGLFDSEAEATKAMDRLLREHIDDLDTRVIDGSASNAANSQGEGGVVPLIPNTSGGPQQGGAAPGMAGAYFGSWLHDMNDVEQHFYQDAVREGSTLALARVSDKDANRVRQMFRSFGARTYEK